MEIGPSTFCKNRDLDDASAANLRFDLDLPPMIADLRLLLDLRLELIDLLLVVPSV